MERQKIEREKERIEGIKKEEQKALDEIRRQQAEDQEFFKKEKEEKERIDNVRAPNSAWIDNNKMKFDNFKTKVRNWLLRYSLLYPILEILDYLKVTIPITFVMFGLYYLITSLMNMRKRIYN